MAARGAPSSLSIPSYPQGGGQGASSDSSRPRGRNHSTGSSGASSREHSVERKGDNRRRGLELRGSGDFRASYHSQFQSPPKREFERVSWGQQLAIDGPASEQNSSRMGAHNWGFGSEGGSSNRDQHWRSNRGGPHGRVQGVFYDDSPGEIGSSTRGYAVTLGGQGRRGGTNAPQRQENGYGGQYRQENGYGGNQRQDNQIVALPDSSSNNRIGEFKGEIVQADRKDDEDLEEKLRRISDQVPVRSSHTSGSSAGSGSGDFHQYRQMRRREQDRLPRVEFDYQKRTEESESLARREERMRAAEERIQRQEKGENGSGGHYRQENGYGGSQRQDNGHGGRGGNGRASQDLGGSFRRRHASFDERGGVGVLRVLPGRDSGASKEVVFGDARELQTFGSPRGLSRTIKAAGSFLSPKEEAKLQRAKNNDARNAGDIGVSFLKGLREGDLRKSFSNESVARGEGWRSSGSSNKGGHLDNNTQTHGKRGNLDVNQEYHAEHHQMGGYGGAQMLERRDQPQSIRGGDQGQRTQAPLTKRRDAELLNPRVSSTSKESSTFTRRSSFEGGRDLPGELPVLSPRLSTKGSFSRKDSLDRKKKREESVQLPVFNPSSEANAESKRASSLDKLAGESSVSESAFKDPGLEGDERWSATANQLQQPSKNSESASAGMHRTRSTDWYEICLKEEEEEQLQALANRKYEEESTLGTQHPPNLIKVRSFSRRSTRDQNRQESDVFSPSSAKGEIKREVNNLERPRFVRGDAVDTAQPNFSAAQINGDSGAKQGLFTPWNSLQQPLSNVKTGPQSAPRPNSLLQQFEKSSGEPRDGPLKHENLRISVAGGRQANGRARRTVNAIDADGAENWRQERRASRDYLKDGIKPESLQEESIASRSVHERRASRDYLRDGVRPESLQEGSIASRSEHERRASRDYLRDGVRPESLQEGSIASRSGHERRASRDYLRDGVRPESLQEGSIASRSEHERRASRDYLRDGVRPESLQEGSIASRSEHERRASRDYLRDGVRPESLQEGSIASRSGHERRASRDYLRDGVRPESLQEGSIASRSGHERRASREYLRDGVRPESLQEESIASRSGHERRASKDYFRDGVRPESLQEESVASRSRHVMPKQEDERDRVLVPAVDIEKRVSEVVSQRVIGATRPAAFYRALQEATGGDEEPLPHIVGTCPDMCPGRERLQRERLRDLAVFERMSGDMRKTSKELAVKKFCRTVVAAELEPSDVRPLPVLWRTQQYLLGLLDDPEFSFDIIHNFLFDRTRAIRQELGMQRIFDHQTITILEELVRFHILSEHELRELNRKRSKQVETHLNLQQLSKSLYSLLNLYISVGGDGGARFKNEAEFHAYYVLLNLGNHGQFQAEPLSLWFPNVPSHVLEGAPMQFARKALRLYRSTNFVGFFRLARKATYLQSCLLELNFDSIRAMALAMLNAAEYKLHPYPLSDLAQQLILEEEEVNELCMYYGLLTGMDNASQKLCLLSKQAQFATPENGSHPQYRCPLIDSKRASSYFQEVKGVTSKI